ncbi:MAG TPA: hypothetical protein VHB48_20750 [Chitinophagaceae bacterium]|nr:hypothetical protein [Chitinophagaceae bacterium]
MTFLQNLLNATRRLLGIAWVLLAPFCIYLIVSNALKAFDKADKAIAAAASDTAKAAAEAAKTNTMLQWGIIIIIFLPIAIGLVIFGKYAMAGEYNTTLAAKNKTA